MPHASTTIHHSSRYSRNRHSGPLKPYDGRCSEFRCPYHAFAWHLDGPLKHIPAGSLAPRPDRAVRRAGTGPVVSDPGVNGDIRHGFSGAMYRPIGDGRLQVTMPGGSTGIFDGIGRWIVGEVYDVDPEMCVWLTAQRITSSHRLSDQT